ncbi:MAG: sulfatase-like hydrolase/transferase [Alphaproteobacteria bacterium]|nr:sulfatase-like hydrolase/transferase [Alphaproteobacteria bacterium]
MREIIRGGLAAAILWLTGLLSALAQEEAPIAAGCPNIILILVDDAAFMDFGVYGGEARTPNIDRLAASGAMMTNYHTSPLCSPSRAMLLTGMDSHRTIVSTIEEVLPPELKGKPGYTLRLEPGVSTIADRLKAEGYRTLMSGKWHLGHGKGDLPNHHGFDRSLALDASGADN